MRSIFTATGSRGAQMRRWVLLFVLVLGFVVVLREMWTTDTERAEALTTELATIAQLRVEGVTSDYQRYQDQTVLLAAWLTQLAELRGESLQNVTQFADPDFKDSVAAAMTRMLETIESIDHARILDMGGKEIVRVQRDPSGGYQRTGEMDLQVKAQRPYFQQFQALRVGQIGATRISLNEERGVVEEPRRSMIRIGIKLDLAGEPALLIVNHLADEMLDLSNELTGQEVYLVDSQGYFLSGGMRFSSWTFGWQLGNDELTLSRALPGLTDVSQQQKQGVLTTDDGWYYWVRSPITSSDGFVPLELREGVLVVFAPWESLATSLRFKGATAFWYWLMALFAFLVLAGAAFRYLRVEQQAIHAKIAAEKANDGLRRAYSRLREEEGRRSDLLAVVGHEVRSPIASLAMLADTNEQEWIESQVTAQRLLRTTLNLLDDLKLVANPASRDADDELSDISLETLIRDSLSSVAPIISLNNMKVAIDTHGDGSTMLRLKAQRVLGVISNLVRNACLHSGGNQIWLSACLRKSPVGSHVRVCVRVEDNGDGIPESERDRLFGMFQRGESSAPGMGIGLHVVKEWIEEMGGEVAYKPSSHGGAGFELEFPAEIGVHPEQQKGGAFSSADGRDNAVVNTIRLDDQVVLLAEDDVLMRKMSVRLLEQLGAFVITAADGQLALDVLDKNQVDFIITDNFMPEVSGLELIKTLRARGDMTPIIACTAATVGHETEKLSEAGANAVVAKPLRRDNLDKIIEELGLVDSTASARLDDVKRLGEVVAAFGDARLLGRILRGTSRLYSMAAEQLEQKGRDERSDVLTDRSLIRIQSRAESLGLESLAQVVRDLKEHAAASRTDRADLQRRLKWRLRGACLTIDEVMARHAYAIGGPAAGSFEGEMPVDAIRRLMNSDLPADVGEQCLHCLMTFFGEEAVADIQLFLDLGESAGLQAALASFIKEHNVEDAELAIREEER